MKKQNFKSRNFRSGSYSTILTVFVVAIIFAVNLVVSALPSTYTKYDFSEQKLFTLTDQTEKVAKNIGEEVTVYIIAESGSEEGTLIELLNKYKALSSKIKVETKDPAVYPAFVGNYTSESLSYGSLIVESGKRFRVISYENLYTVSYDSTGTSTNTEFNGEDLITSAIDYVTTDELPKMYVISGHGESALDSSFQSAVQRENIDLVNLALATVDSIPEDADGLFMQAPVKDISENEANVLLAYLKQGGSLFYTSFYEKEDTPNLDRVLADYGVEVQEGYVCEGDSNYYIQNYNNFIIPTYGNHEITEPLVAKSMNVVVALGQNVKKLEEKRSTVGITSLLKTTASAYNKSLANGNAQELTLTKEEGDESGLMVLALAISEEVEQGETKIVIATTPYLYNSDMNTNVSGGNYDFLLNAIGYLCEHESMISIRGKDVYSQSLTVASGQAVAWMIGLVIIVPLGSMVTGLAVFLRRRKR